MADAVEAAIKNVLFRSLATFAAAQSPALTVSWPNIAFSPPTVSATASWLRVTMLPADTAPMGIAFSSMNHHYGLFQVDTFYGQGSGELGITRTAALIIANFTRGTNLSSDGFTIRILEQPYLGPMLKDDPWMMLPVRIPYTAYASPA